MDAGLENNLGLMKNNIRLRIWTYNHHRPDRPDTLRKRCIGAEVVM